MEICEQFLTSQNNCIFLWTTMCALECLTFVPFRLRTFFFDHFFQHMDNCHATCSIFVEHHFQLLLAAYAAQTDITACTVVQAVV